jgi:hypothetical protein
MSFINNNNQINNYPETVFNYGPYYYTEYTTNNNVFNNQNNFISFECESPNSLYTESFAYVSPSSCSPSDSSENIDSNEHLNHTNYQYNYDYKYQTQMENYQLSHNYTSVSAYSAYNYYPESGYGYENTTHIQERENDSANVSKRPNFNESANYQKTLNCARSRTYHYQDLSDPKIDLSQPNVTTITQKPVDMGETKRYNRKNIEEIEKRRFYACNYPGKFKLLI